MPLVERGFEEGTIDTQGTLRWSIPLPSAQQAIPFAPGALLMVSDARTLFLVRDPQ